MCKGASSGIGRATAILFSRLGAQLMLTGRSKENLLDTCSQCRSPVSHVVGDLTKESDVENIVNEAVAKLGKLDVLVSLSSLLIDFFSKRTYQI